MQARAYTQEHMHKHTYACMHVHTHTCTNTHAHTHTDKGLTFSSGHFKCVRNIPHNYPQNQFKNRPINGHNQEPSLTSPQPLATNNGHSYHHSHTKSPTITQSLTMQPSTTHPPGMNLLGIADKGSQYRRR